MQSELERAKLYGDRYSGNGGNGMNNRTGGFGGNGGGGYSHPKNMEEARMTQRERIDANTGRINNQNRMLGAALRDVESVSYTHLTLPTICSV